MWLSSPKKHEPRILSNFLRQLFQTIHIYYISTESMDIDTVRFGYANAGKNFQGDSELMI